MLETEAVVAFVPVTDLARARQFYQVTLGLSLRSGDDYGCMLDCGGTALRLAQVPDYERPPHTILGWEVRSIAGAVATMTAAGVAFYRYEGMAQDEQGVWTAPSGDRVAWLSDTEGNTLSVTQPA
jgi:predicted enzyme related to lactoylglutathione lyase